MDTAGVGLIVEVWKLILVNLYLRESGDPPSKTGEVGFRHLGVQTIVDIFHFARKRPKGDMYGGARLDPYLSGPLPRGSRCLAA